MGKETTKYLNDRTIESFKRQIDLEESIWRSAPLIVTVLSAYAATIAWIAHRLSPPPFHFYQILTYLLFAMCGAFFLLSYWLLFEIVRPRTYEYPALDQAIAAYALDLEAHYAAAGLTDEALDSQVLGDLQLYITESFGAAATSAFQSNQTRINARGQLLRGIMVGFGVAFFCILAISAHQLVAEMRPAQTTAGHDDSRPKVQAIGSGTQNMPACAASDAAHSGQHPVALSQHRTEHPGKKVNGGRFDTDESAGRANSGGETDAPTNAAADKNRHG